MRETYANTIPLDLGVNYSYTDYLSWDFKENLELINGQIFPINSKIDSYHQHISSKILSAMAIFFQNFPYKLLSFPEEIKLVNEKAALYNDNPISIVRPDISITSNGKNIAIQSCNEIPDLIVEIPTTGFSKVEMNKKFNLYEEVGIRE
ncbi:Uma2 family endonuclease [Dyadobacter sp. 3J3]|uniref:Uma2 family endonuclease n=1 Tax=Dyadobacter sp. 3J3 TaxID=2606600 RepID=UPI00135CE080|nr:Uma2 family endonuclease [Dyadobacter sp. 3J3]